MTIVIIAEVLLPSAFVSAKKAVRSGTGYIPLRFRLMIPMAATPAPPIKPMIPRS